MALYSLLYQLHVCASVFNTRLLSMANALPWISAIASLTRALSLNSLAKLQLPK